MLALYKVVNGRIIVGLSFLFFLNFSANLIAFDRNIDKRNRLVKYSGDAYYDKNSKAHFNGYDLVLSLLTKYRENNEPGFLKTGITKSSVLKYLKMALVSALIGAIWYYPTTMRKDFSIENLKFPNLIPYFWVPTTLFFILIWLGNKYYKNSQANISKLKYVLDHFDIIEATIPSLAPILRMLYFDKNKDKIYIEDEEGEKLLTESEAEKIIFNILNICWSNTSRANREAIKNMMLYVATDPKLKALVRNL